MVFDLIQEDVLHIQEVDMVKMLLFLGLIWAVQLMLITKQEVF